MEEKHKKYAVLYICVPPIEFQLDAESCERKLRNYCRNKGFIIKDIIKDTYDEDDVKKPRHKLQTMLQNLNYEEDSVIIVEMNHLDLDYLACVQIVETIFNKRCKIVIPGTTTLTGNKNDQFMVNILVNLSTIKYGLANETKST